MGSAKQAQVALEEMRIKRIQLRKRKVQSGKNADAVHEKHYNN